MTKKSSQRTPNLRLKAERQSRGWSQQYVAEQLGADYYYLSRWERGTASPSPFYRQKLCELFGKNAYELGFIEEESEQPAEHPSSPAEVSPKLYDWAVPAPDTPDIIGRDRLLAKLTERLSAEKSPGLLALYGLPGVGKTTLAALLLANDRILAHFEDGFLWASLGPQPNLLAIFSRWGRLLGLADVEAARLTSVEAWTQRLHQLIGARKILIVIDDAWSSEDALAFKIGGIHTSYLLTTRFVAIALQLASGEALAVEELAEQESLDLLEKLATGLAEREPQAALNLVRAVGGLPLALTLVGRYLRVEMHSRQSRRLHAALARLQRAEERIKLSAPQSMLERSSALSGRQPVSLQSIIEVSDQLLTPEARQTLRALAIFPAKPNTFTEEAALFVSNASPEILDGLIDTGFIESVNGGRYTLHQVLADYARVNQQDQPARQRFVAYFTEFVTTHERDYALLEQESSNSIAALDIAYEDRLRAEFVQLVHASLHFWLARGWYVRATAYLEKSEEFARVQGDSKNLTISLLYQGNIARMQGQYQQADRYLQEGLTLAQQLGTWDLICDCLAFLGRSALYQCKYQIADTYLLESLRLARLHADTRRIGEILKSLGAGANDQGQYERGLHYFEEGLALARQGQNQDLLIELLVDLGQNASFRGDYALAEAVWLEGLILARQIGYLHALAMLLGNLGAIAIEQQHYEQARPFLLEALEYSRRRENREGTSVDLANLGYLELEQKNYVQAEIYLREAVTLARQTDNPWVQSGVLNYWADLHLKRPQPDLTLAEQIFQEMLGIASSGLREYEAEALFGLARVAFARGDLNRAHELGRDSLNILGTIGNRTAPVVSAWLDSLPASLPISEDA